jgi:hypothetical protein
MLSDSVVKEIAMRWMLAGDWPVGAGLIPAGTILGDDAIPPPTVPLPINAMALDEEAAHQMCLWYDEAASIGGWHALHFHHSIKRDAVLAKARHEKRFPGGVAKWGAVAEKKEEEETQKSKPPGSLLRVSSSTSTVKET